MGYGKLNEEQLRILEDVPGSAVELQVKDKVSLQWNQANRLASKIPNTYLNSRSFQYLRKLNRQERVVEEVKLVLKPHYNKKHITKDDYKDILRRAVPKVSGTFSYN